VVEDTWFTRDLPVLDAVVTLLEGGEFRAAVRDISAATGFDPEDVARSLKAMEHTYVGEFTQLITGGDPNPWYVTEVTSAARQAVGQWPTPENVVARLADEFAAAAEHEPDPERKGKLRAIAGFLGETGKDFAAEIVAKVIARQTGLG
jgi:hypothetical protein